MSYFICYLNAYQGATFKENNWSQNFTFLFQYLLCLVSNLFYKIFLRSSQFKKRLKKSFIRVFVCLFVFKYFIAVSYYGNSTMYGHSLVLFPIVILFQVNSVVKSSENHSHSSIRPNLPYSLLPSIMNLFVSLIVVVISHLCVGYLMNA